MTLNSLRFLGPLRSYIPQSYDLMFDSAYALVAIFLIGQIYDVHTNAVFASTALFFCIIASGAFIELTFIRGSQAMLLTFIKMATDPLDPIGSRITNASDEERQSVRTLLSLMRDVYAVIWKRVRHDPHLHREFVEVMSRRSSWQQDEPLDDEALALFQNIIAWVCAVSPILLVAAYPYIAALARWIYSGVGL